MMRANETTAAEDARTPPGVAARASRMFTTNGEQQ